jgi:hypothetical protein
MTFSSKSTPRRSNLAVVGFLLLLAGGCARNPEKVSAPPLVYVSTDRLIKSHPQWDDVLMLEREMRSLVNDRPPDSISRFEAAAPLILPEPVSRDVDTIALQASISRQLQAVHDRLLEQREQRLQRTSRLDFTTIGAQLALVRAQAAEDADRQRAEVDAEYEHRLVNLRTWREYVASSIRLRPEWARLGLDEDLAAVDALITEIAFERDGRIAFINQKALQAGRDAAAKLREESNQRLEAERTRMEEALNAQLAEQRRVLYASLANSGPRWHDEIRAREWDGASRATLRIEPTVRLERHDLLATLAERRKKLVDYIRQDTRAIVKARADRLGVRISFDTPPSPADDATEGYRSDVSGGGRVLSVPEL